MLANGRRIGAHLPLGDGMVKAADRAAEIGASAIQVFTDNPTAWRRRPTLPDEQPAFRERLAAHDIAPIAVHAPYLVNLAGPDTAFYDQSSSCSPTSCASPGPTAPRSSTSTSAHTAARSPGRRHTARGRARKVLEPANADSSDDGASTCGHARRRPLPRLVLENGAGGGFGLGATIEELAGIEAATAAAGIGRDRFGYRLDTAHLWGAGYAIDTPDGGRGHRGLR